jgi:O-antigen/teichoic acid export membrane protein
MEPIVPFFDSLKKRYAYKMVTNFVNLLFASIIISIVPRHLGPDAYGNFNYLLEFFNKTLSFFQAGTSIGFYTKLSKRLQDTKLIYIYAGFLVIIFILMMLSTIALLNTSFKQILWPNQRVIYILLAAILSIVTFIVQIIRYINDAYGLTARSELQFILIKLIGIIAILCIVYFKTLNLYIFFIYNILLFLAIFIVWFTYLIKKDIVLKARVSISKFEIINFSRELYEYSHPLLLISLAGLIVGLGDRWLLQVFQGSEQQGYYSIAQRVGTLCLIFTGAMTPLITREFSIAHEQKDIKRIRKLFQKNIPLFYVIAAYLSIFVSCFGSELSLILGGSEFEKAGPTLSIMALYPIHQTYGQLSGSVFLATGQTKLYRNIGVSMMIVGLITTFIFIAPNKYGGLNLGASGLALRMIIVQFIGANIQLKYNATYLKISFIKYFTHQIIVALGLYSIVYLSRTLALLFISNVMLTVIISGLIYTISTLAIIYKFPRIIIMTQQELKNHLKPILSRLYSRRD